MGLKELAIIVAMILINSVFAGYEIALASIGKSRLRRLSEENRPGAAAALHMKDNMEASLAVVQLGITLVGVIAAAVGGASAEESLAPGLAAYGGVSNAVAELLALIFVVIPLTFITILFGELVPKVFALRNAEWVCLTLSPMMRWFSRIVWPAVWLLETIVTAVMSWGERFKRGSVARSETAELQELRAAASLARTSRLIGQREEGIILGAAELKLRPVRTITLPADAICMLAAGDSLEQSLVAAYLDMHTRFPVCEQPGQPQTIVGYVNVKDILATLKTGSGDSTLRSIIRPILSFPDHWPISDCLERLIRDHQHLAIIRDDRQRVVGMITLEDIFEELVGDIEDEYDRLPAHVQTVGSSWVAGGGIPLERLRTTAGLDLGESPDKSRTRTLNDWVMDKLNRPIRGGDVVESDGVRVLVRKVRRQKVQEAQISRIGSR